MDDRFLNELRREPRPEFERDLRRRLEAAEARSLGRPRWGPAWWSAAVAAGLAIALFTVPSMRASAEAFLDLFRVRTFTAVSFDPARFERLKDLRQADGPLVFDRQERANDPGPPRYEPSLAAAAAAAGLTVRRPTFLPEGLAADSVFVIGDGRMRLGVSEAKLRAVLDALDLRDVAVPAGLDGRWIEVHKPPMVIQQFRGAGAGATARLVQAQSPEVAVPAGVDVERLAEIGLRVLGLDAGEASRVARATDWRSTLLVPVPTNASTFRQVTVHGQQALLITTTGGASGGAAPGNSPNRAGPRGEHRWRPGSILLWTEAGHVYALMSMGGLPSADVLQMAESVR